jgi:hypothetical protein
MLIIALLLLAVLDEIYFFQHFEESLFKIIIKLVLWLLL